MEGLGGGEGVWGRPYKGTGPRPSLGEGTSGGGEMPDSGESLSGTAGARRWRRGLAGPWPVGPTQFGGGGIFFLTVLQTKKNNKTE